jgi:hypothetical protein
VVDATQTGSSLFQARCLLGSSPGSSLCSKACNILLDGMLFKSEDIKGILAGDITLAFRRWVRPTVKAGGTLRIPGHVLAIEAVEVIEAVLEKLSRMDSHGGNGAWTRQVLAAIGASPGKLAALLAKSLGYEKMWFKTHVRKLKALGLTQSLEIGYRLSPRGRKVLSHMK